MLFERDYTILTKDEEVKLKEAEDYLWNNRESSTAIIPADVEFKYDDLKPKAAYYHESLFPNHFLSQDFLRGNLGLEKIEAEFKKLLGSNISERDLLNFITKNKYYNLIASLFTGYEFGHHGAYMFKEFELTSTYRADYLLIGKNSHGYHFVFIELENPIGSITKKDGSFGHTINKGLSQIRDWDRWIEGNFNSLKLIFRKYTNKKIGLPGEFLTLDKTRINYVVIAGRRNDFSENTYNEKRRIFQKENIKVLHYDNLIDSFNTLKKSNNY